MNKSDIYRNTNCPIPTGEGNYHEGLDNLLNLIADNGLKPYHLRIKLDEGRWQL